MGGETDKGLVILMKQGDKNAYREIYMRYYSRLCYYLLTFTDSREIAEDAAQEALIALWETREKLREDGSLSGFLHRVAYNEFANYFRKKKTLEKTIDTLKAQAYQEFEEEDGELLERKIALLKSAIDELPDRCREIFLMCKQQKRSQKEVAEELGISPKTVENQVSKALKILRESVDLEALIVLFAIA